VYKYQPPTGETLRQKQSRFVLMIADLINYARSGNFELTFGDAYRENNTLCHGMRLAIDFNLFVDGKYCHATEWHAALGGYWEFLSPDARWGGRFKQPDGNHYSLTHEGKS